jgi:hypothetical protein
MEYAFISGLAVRLAQARHCASTTVKTTRMKEPTAEIVTAFLSSKYRYGEGHPGPY